MNSAPASIAFFMHDLSGGGVERMRLRLGAALADRGHAVTLIVQSARGELRGHVPATIDLVELGRIRTWRAIPALRAVLRRLRPDFLVSSLDHNNIAALLAQAFSSTPTRLIICQHNNLSAERALGWRYRVIPLLYTVLGRWADGIVAVSDGVADDLASLTRLSRARISVIHNPVISATAPAPAAPAPHPWLADPAVPVFLFVGRLAPQKDPAHLLRAFARRLRAGPARLVLLGDGPLLAPLRRAAAAAGLSDHVHFAGFVPDPRPWMDHAAALVLSSRYEGFGNVLVEAMARGTPVIAADCPHGPREILAGGRFGWLTRVGDDADLAAAMGDDARASFPAQRLILRSHAFSVKACADRHEALFDRLRRARPRVLGLAFSVSDAEHIAARLVREPAGDSMRCLVTPNLDHLRLMRALPEFAAACRAADIACADGFAVAAYARLRGARTGRRVTGCDIFSALVRTQAKSRGCILVVAESAVTADKVRNWAAARGEANLWHSLAAPLGLLRDDHAQAQLAAAIVAARPAILVMTLGAPTSELFLHRHRVALPPCWAICCGQAVRVELGLARRAPWPVQRLNLEWAWRVLQEPRRLGPRYVRDALAIPGMILSDLRAAAAERRAPAGWDQPAA